MQELAQERIFVLAIDSVKNSFRSDSRRIIVMSGESFESGKLSIVD